MSPIRNKSPFTVMLLKVVLGRVSDAEFTITEENKEIRNKEMKNLTDLTISYAPFTLTPIVSMSKLQDL